MARNFRTGKLYDISEWMRQWVGGYVRRTISVAVATTLAKPDCTAMQRIVRPLKCGFGSSVM